MKPIRIFLKKLTIFVLLLLPASSWIIGKVGKSLKKRSAVGQQEYSDMISQIEETLGGLRIIKAFNAEEKVSERFRGVNEKLRKTFNKIDRRFNMAHPISLTCLRKRRPSSLTMH